MKGLAYVPSPLSEVMTRLTVLTTFCCRCCAETCKNDVKSNMQRMKVFNSQIANIDILLINY
jgi:hypothetical protein